ncbi:MAG: SDR family NAD(P)-dependent oxidoreductase [Pirellula sp.]
MSRLGGQGALNAHQPLVTPSSFAFGPIVSCVLVTGSSTGIGSATVGIFARKGWTVFAGVRNELDGQRLVKDNSGLNVVPVLLDVTSPDLVRTAFETIVSHPVGRHGLHALVNNAGQFLLGPIESLPIGEWRQLFEVNFFGLFDVTQVFLPLIHKVNGRIINIGSVGGRITQPLCGVYTATKFALSSANDALRMELGKQGPKVILIEPGVVSTPLVEKAMGSYDRAVSQIPKPCSARYVPALKAFTKTSRVLLRSAITSDDVATIVHKAATVLYPSPRYLIGRDAYLLVALKCLLPTKWLDSLLRRVMRLHKNFEVESAPPASACTTILPQQTRQLAP